MKKKIIVMLVALLVIGGGSTYLHSLNPEYKNMPITPDTDFRIIGEVVDLYRGE